MSNAFRGPRFPSLYSERDARELGVKRLQLLTDPTNMPSQRVAVRVGFRREGILRSYLDLGDRRRDGVMYALLWGELAPDRE